MIIEEEIEVPTPDGVADAVLYRDDAGRRLPAVLQLTDIGGIRPATRDMARRVSEKGYTVLMPNVFYRTSPSPIWSFPRNHAEERTKNRFRELVSPITPDAMLRDGAAYLDFLGRHDSVTAGGMAVVGYCFTGSMALRITAGQPDRIVAAASFHGAGLVTDQPASPHLVLPRIKARLYFGHAEGDSGMPPEAIAALDHALAAWGGRYESELYEGAKHGWTVSDSPVYNEKQSARAFGKLTELLAATLQ